MKYTARHSLLDRKRNYDILEKLDASLVEKTKAL
jgi:hypothetical protein